VNVKRVLEYRFPERRWKLSIAHAGLACAAFVFLSFASGVLLQFLSSWLRVASTSLLHDLVRFCFFISFPLSLLAFCLVALGNSPRIALFAIIVLVISYVILVVGIPYLVPTN
jgi:hypothetical protein